MLKTLLDKDFRVEYPRELGTLKKSLVEMLLGIKASILLTV